MSPALFNRPASLAEALALLADPSSTPLAGGTDYFANRVGCGGFGGKLDMSVQPLLAVASKKVGRAVRTVWERPESMLVTTKRHPSQMIARAACSADGDLLAYDFRGDFNTGAYSCWGPTVANRVPIHASGPHRVPNDAGDPDQQLDRRLVSRLRRAAVDGAGGGAAR